MPPVPPKRDLGRRVIIVIKTFIREIIVNRSDRCGFFFKCFRLLYMEVSYSGYAPYPQLFESVNCNTNNCKTFNKKMKWV